MSLFSFSFPTFLVEQVSIRSGHPHLHGSIAVLAAKSQVIVCVSVQPRGCGEFRIGLWM